MSASMQSAEAQTAERPSPAKTSLIGSQLGKNYRVIEPIGAGGMGVVYLVEHTKLKKRFAAKVLNSELAQNAEACARFEVEAHAVSQLDHDNIINVIDYGTSEDGLVFMVMEYLKGRTLQARIDETPLSRDELLAVMLQVCHALGCAHEAGIVHRDMKPDNIFLNERMRGRPPLVKVLDFGISKARDVSLRDGRITKQGQVLGSPEYMSPEAARGDEVDARADIYAVGIILYELVTGNVPFRSENYLKVLQLHISEKPKPPSAALPGLSEGMERLILRALAKHPDGRQQTMEELEEDLLEAMPEEASRVLNPRRPTSGNWLFTPPIGVPVTRPMSEPPITPTPASSPAVEAAPTPLPAADAAAADAAALALAADTSARRRRFFVRAGGAAAIAILLGFLGFRHVGGDREPAAPVKPAITSSPSPSAPAAPTQRETTPTPVAEPQPPVVPGRPTVADKISFRVDSTPRGATVSLNGKTVGRTPVAIQMTRSRKGGQLKIALKDHEPITQKVDLSRPVDLNIPLQPVAAAKPDAGTPPPDDLRQNR